jgi:hypothetical protein
VTAIARRPMIPARPTIYRGIRMRSRLEAAYAQWLDACGFDWEYEPCAFGGRGGQYLPDFVIRRAEVDGHYRDVWVEVKPRFPTWDGFPRFGIILESLPRAATLLQFPRDPNGDPLTNRAGAWLFGYDEHGPRLQAMRWVARTRLTPVLMPVEEVDPFTYYGPTT